MERYHAMSVRSLTARHRQSLAEVSLALESADEIVGRREPAEVGHSPQVPLDDAWLHAGRSGVKKDALSNWAGAEVHRSLTASTPRRCTPGGPSRPSACSATSSSTPIASSRRPCGTRRGCWRTRPEVVDHLQGASLMYFLKTHPSLTSSGTSRERRTLTRAHPLCSPSSAVRA